MDTQQEGMNLPFTNLKQSRDLEGANASSKRFPSKYRLGTLIQVPFPLPDLSSSCNAELDHHHPPNGIAINQGRDARSWPHKSTAQSPDHTKI